MMNNAAEEANGWTKIITPKRNLLDFRLEEILHYRDLLFLLVRRDFVATYKQTVLGPIWFLLQPLLTTLMFTVIFGGVAGLSTDGLPRFLFYMCGVVAWTYFADCVNKTAVTFTKNAGIFGKVYFPRLVVPLSVVITNFFSFVLQFTLFLCFLLYYELKGAPVEPNWRMVIVPILLFQMAALGLGVGCLISSMTTKYKDLALAVGFGVQLWMYASSVVVPLSEIDPQYRWILLINPMVPIIESFRFAFLGAGVIEIWQLAISFCVSMAVLFFGIMLFNRVEQTVMDTV